jgi:hypothetical protein
VLIALADQLDAETGEGLVSVLELAKAASVSARTVKRAIGWAKTADLLERTSRGHHLGDGTVSASGWRLLGESAPQSVSSPASQSASSPQSVRTAKTQERQSRNRTARKGGTPTPPSASEVLAHRDYCRDCGFELNPVLAEAGKKVHAGCTDPLDDAPVTTTGRTT